MNVIPIKREDQEQTNIFEKAVLLNLELRRLGTRRKVASSEVTVNADKDMLHVSKDILVSPELKTVQSFDNESRQIVNKRCLPSNFRAGLYLLPVDLLEETDVILQDRQGKRPLLIEVFLKRYTELTEEAKKKLNTLFNQKDYPGVDRVREAFSMSYSYLEMSAPGRLAKMNPVLFRRESEALRERMANAVEESIQAMRAGFADLIEHMIERLTPGEDGKRKSFQYTTVQNLIEFMELFPAKNLAGDSDLGLLIDQTKKLLGGIDAKQLRKSDSLRDYVSEGFSDIKRKLDPLVVAKGRMIEFADQDELSLEGI